MAEYLAGHARAGELRVALAGRTMSKVEAITNKYPNFVSVYVDVSEEESIVAAVEKTRVVMNLAGPYWTHGSNVVRSVAPLALLFPLIDYLQSMRKERHSLRRSGGRKPLACQDHSRASRVANDISHIAN